MVTRLLPVANKEGGDTELGCVDEIGASCLAITGQMIDLLGMSNRHSFHFDHLSQHE
jgi:hypothetical protein